MAYSLGRALARPGRAYSGRFPGQAPSLIHSPAARLRLALILCLGAAGFFAFVVLPPRRVSVSADGKEQLLLSRNADPALLLKQAGVERAQNDIVVREGAGLKVERALPVVLEADGHNVPWRSRVATVGELLAEMDMPFGPYDSLYVDGIEARPGDALANGAPAVLPPELMAVFGHGAAGTPGVRVTIYRAVPYGVVEDGHGLSFRSSRPTVGSALKEAGITLGPADVVSPDASQALMPGLSVTVKHAAVVTIKAAGSSQVVHTQASTLRDALAEAGLVLGPDDRVEPGIDAPVENGMTARVVRIAGRPVYEREPVKHKTVFKPDEELHGSASLIVPGHDGVRLHEYRIMIEDGVETEKRLVGDSYDPEPVDTVIYYAAGDIQAAGLPAGGLAAQKTMSMNVTWYDAASSGKAATDPSYGITASGAPVTKGIVAIDPRVIPLGTRLFIPGYGFAVAGDTGGGVIGNIVDLGYPDGVVPDFQTGRYDVYILS